MDNQTEEKITIMQLIDNINLMDEIFQFNPDLESKTIEYIDYLKDGINEFLKKYEVNTDKKHHYEYLLKRLDEIQELKRVSKVIWDAIKFIEFCEKLNDKSASYIYALRNMAIEFHHLKNCIRGIRMDLKFVYIYSGIDPKFSREYFVDKYTELCDKLNSMNKKYKIPYIGYGEYSYY